MFLSVPPMREYNRCAESYSKGCIDARSSTAVNTMNINPSNKREFEKVGKR